MNKDNNRQARVFKGCDTVYLEKKQNSQPDMLNPSTAGNTSYGSATRNVNGQNASFRLRRSEIDVSMPHGTEHFTAAVSATCNNVRVAALTSEDFPGKPGPTTKALAERGHIELALQTQF